MLLCDSLLECPAVWHGLCRSALYNRRFHSTTHVFEIQAGPMKQGQLRIVCPSGHLGYLPYPESAFRHVSQVEADYYCWNSGVIDPDPFLVGVDSSLSLYEWQKHDLELALLAARRRHIPLLIATAGDTGTDSRVDLYVECLRHLSRKHNLAPFTLTYFYTEVTKHALTRFYEQTLPGAEHVDADAMMEERLEQTDRIVAIAGIHPYRRALETDADVIIGGRSCYASMIAAVALHNGFPSSLAYSLGYALERYGASSHPGQALLGQIADDAVNIRFLNPQASRSGAVMPEPLPPCPPPSASQQPPDGTLDLSKCSYHRIDDNTVQIRGAAFLHADDPMRVRLEGVGKVGERCLGILRVSDAAGLESIDRLFEWTLAQIADHFTGKPYRLTYHAYTRHPMADSSEPLSSSGAWFLLVEGLAETGQLAEELTMMATRMLMSAMPVSLKQPAGNAVLTLESLLAAPPLYQWTIQQTLAIPNPNDLFDLHMLTIM